MLKDTKILHGAEGNAEYGNNSLWLWYYEKPITHFHIIELAV